MNAQWLLAWWNLIFVVPFGLALVYLGFYTLTGVSFGDPEADADADVDADGDVDADAEVDANVDADADGEIDADAEVDGDAEADAEADGDHDADGEQDADSDHDPDGGIGGGRVPLALALFAFLGVGRVPLSILLTVLLFTWGAVGFMANALAQPRLGDGPKVSMVSVPVALAAGLMMTRAVSGLICRFMPLNETSARRRHELLGYTGTAIYPVGEQFGLVAVRDGDGNLFQVPCRVEDGREPIGKGRAVLLVGYSAKQQIFHVIPDDATAAANPAAGGAGATKAR